MSDLEEKCFMKLFCHILVPFLGLFSDSHMDYEIERDKSRAGEPSLAEMTGKAIQVLQNNKQGFFLLVEGKCLCKVKVNNFSVMWGWRQC